MPRFLLLLALLFHACSGTALAQAVSAAVLVATPRLQDPNFREAVVLVTHHGAAVIGIVLNRPLDTPLSALFPKVPKLDAGRDRLHFGGPVAPQTLVFMFRADAAQDGAFEIMDGVYLSFRRELLLRLLARDNPTQDLRVFAGYAGWAPGQLERETAHGSWRLVPPDAQLLFRSDTRGLWRELIERRPGQSAQLPPPLPRRAQGA